MREPISIMVLAQLLACCTEMKIEPGPFDPAVGNFELCVSLATLDELRKVLHKEIGIALLISQKIFGRCKSACTIIPTAHCGRAMAKTDPHGPVQKSSTWHVT